MMIRDSAIHRLKKLMFLICGSVMVTLYADRYLREHIGKVNERLSGFYDRYGSSFEPKSYSCATSQQIDPFNNPHHIDNMTKYVTQIVYNRVPKAGSGSARIHMAHLASRNGFTVIPYGRHDCAHASENILRREAERTLQRRMPWLYIGHIHFINFTKFGFDKQPVFINLVRDPVDCFVSTYYFLRFKHPRPMTNERRNMTFDECVLINDPECTSYENITRFIPYFCGHDTECLHGGPKGLQKAKHNIVNHYSVIGYLENIDAFYEALETMLPHFFRGIVIEYKTNGKMAKEKSAARKKLEPSSLARTEFQRRLAHEYELYAFIKQRFDCLSKRISMIDNK